MIQVRSRPGGASPLPPPPAPPSRDANPWSMPGARPAQRPPGLRVDPARRSSKRAWLPWVIAAAVLIGVVVPGAIEALRRGDAAGALVPLVILGFIAFRVLRSLLRAKR